MLMPKYISRFSVYGILLLLVAASIFPFYWMIVVGSNTTASVNQVPPALVPGSNYFANLGLAIERSFFGLSLLNSALVASVTTISVLFFSSLSGFAFAKLRFPGSNILFFSIIITMMIPTQLGVIPQYMIITSIGLLDTLTAVVLPSVANAFGVFWMRQYISIAVPFEMIESARMDGGKNFLIYRRIVVPIIKPAFATLGIFTFMHSWNDFFWPLIVLQSSRKQTIQLVLRNLNDTYYQDYAMMLSATFLATLPLLLVFILFNKYFIAGITDGALKQ